MYFTRLSPFVCKAGLNYHLTTSAVFLHNVLTIIIACFCYVFFPTNDSYSSTVATIAANSCDIVYRPNDIVILKQYVKTFSILPFQLEIVCPSKYHAYRDLTATAHKSKTLRAKGSEGRKSLGSKAKCTTYGAKWIGSPV